MYNDNAILAEPLKTRSDSDQLKAYEAILTQAGKGTALTMHWMDNEASIAIKRLLTEQLKLEYQLVLPHTHRRNAAEWAIWTFKNHFITGLCSTSRDYN
jgi:TnpA family transposase